MASADNALLHLKNSSDHTQPLGMGMGLLTQDQQSQKELTKLYKIFKFGVYQGNDEQDTAIQNLRLSWEYLL